MTDTEHKLAVLAKIAKQFNAAGILWCLGASADLYLLGIADSFHDLDISVFSEHIGRAKEIADRLGTRQPPNPGVRFETKQFLEYVIDGVEVDLMAGFAIVSGGRVHDCSLTEDQIEKEVLVGGERIPLQKPGLWKRYYRLMERADKVRMLEKIDEI